jgi:hypothetical protein
MTTPQPEYRQLLRQTLITTTFCTAAVSICYFWIDRPVAFFVYRHQHQHDPGFSMAHLPTARNPELVGSGINHLNGATGVGTISALAEGAASRVSQLDCCR